MCDRDPISELFFGQWCDILMKKISPLTKSMNFYDVFVSDGIEISRGEVVWSQEKSLVLFPWSPLEELFISSERIGMGFV